MAFHDHLSRCIALHDWRWHMAFNNHRPWRIGVENYRCRFVVDRVRCDGRSEKTTDNASDDSA